MENTWSLDKITVKKQEGLHSGRGAQVKTTNFLGSEQLDQKMNNGALD